MTATPALGSVPGLYSWDRDANLSSGAINSAAAATLGEEIPGRGPVSLACFLGILDVLAEEGAPIYCSRGVGVGGREHCIQLPLVLPAPTCPPQLTKPPEGGASGPGGGLCLFQDTALSTREFWDSGCPDAIWTRLWRSQGLP